MQALKGAVHCCEGRTFRLSNGGRSLSYLPVEGQEQVRAARCLGKSNQVGCSDPGIVGCTSQQRQQTWASCALLFCLPPRHTPNTAPSPRSIRTPSRHRALRSRPACSRTQVQTPVGGAWPYPVPVPGPLRRKATVLRFASHWKKWGPTEHKARNWPLPFANQSTRRRIEIAPAPVVPMETLVRVLALGPGRPRLASAAMHFQAPCAHYPSRCIRTQANRAAKTGRAGKGDVGDPCWPQSHAAHPRPAKRVNGQYYDVCKGAARTSRTAAARRKCARIHPSSTSAQAL